MDSHVTTGPGPRPENAGSITPRPARPIAGTLRAALLVFGAAMAACAVETTFGTMPGLNGVPHGTWLGTLPFTLPSWLVASALAPAVFAYARRFPFRSGSAWRSLAAHVFGAAIFIVVHVGVSVAILPWFSHQPRNWAGLSLYLLRYYALSELLVYATGVGIWNAIQFHREALSRERDTAELRQRLVEARLDALRLQLQPHFLFNTLQAIAVMARAQETETLVRTVSHLGDLLRAVLDEELGPEVKLEHEIALLKKYVEIQHVRFRDRLTVCWDIAEECAAARVPSLILQPIVENAMVHGIEARPGPGEVRIGAERIGEWLRLTVEDSGPGLVAEVPPRRSGIGLANTRARLEHRYGERMRMASENSERGGARFVIEIPFEPVATRAAT